MNLTISGITGSQCKGFLSSKSIPIKTAAKEAVEMAEKTVEKEKEAISKMANVVDPYTRYQDAVSGRVLVSGKPFIEM